MESNQAQTSRSARSIRLPFPTLLSPARHNQRRSRSILVFLLVALLWIVNHDAAATELIGGYISPRLPVTINNIVLAYTVQKNRHNDTAPRTVRHQVNVKSFRRPILDHRSKLISYAIVISWSLLLVAIVDAAYAGAMGAAAVRVNPILPPVPMFLPPMESQDC